MNNGIMAKLTPKRKYELIPCPFCGGEADISEFDNASMIWAKCSECGAESDMDWSIDKVVEKWNRRV